MASGSDVMQMLMARGLSPVHAAALAGHMAQESGYNPNAFNPKEEAEGLIQWRLGRRDNLNRFASERGGKKNDIGTQLDFILHEMAGPEKKAGAQFFSATDLPSVHAALKNYIRYGDNSDASRIGEAQRLLGGGGAAVSPAQPTAAAPFALAGADPQAVPQAAPQPVALRPQEPEEEFQPMQIQMAQPLGLARVRRLLAAMNKQGSLA